MALYKKGSKKNTYVKPPVKKPVVKPPVVPNAYKKDTPYKAPAGYKAPVLTKPKVYASTGNFGGISRDIRAITNAYKPPASNSRASTLLKSLQDRYNLLKSEANRITSLSSGSTSRITPSSVQLDTAKAMGSDQVKTSSLKAREALKRAQAQITQNVKLKASTREDKKRVTNQPLINQRSIAKPQAAAGAQDAFASLSQKLAALKGAPMGNNLSAGIREAQTMGTPKQDPAAQQRMASYFNEGGLLGSLSNRVGLTASAASAEPLSAPAPVARTPQTQAQINQKLNMMGGGIGAALNNAANQELMAQTLNDHYGYTTTDSIGPTTTAAAGTTAPEPAPAPAPATVPRPAATGGAIGGAATGGVSGGAMDSGTEGEAIESWAFDGDGNETDIQLIDGRTYINGQRVGPQHAGMFIFTDGGWYQVGEDGKGYLVTEDELPWNQAMDENTEEMESVIPEDYTQEEYDAMLAEMEAAYAQMEQEYWDYIEELMAGGGTIGEYMDYLQEGYLNNPEMDDTFIDSVIMPQLSAIQQALESNPGSISYATPMSTFVDPNYGSGEAYTEDGSGTGGVYSESVSGGGGFADMLSFLYNQLGSRGPR